MTWPLFEEGSTRVADPEMIRAWEADPEPFWVVAVLLPSRALLQRRAAVAALPWLIASTPGQAHITIRVTGGFRPSVVPQPVEVVVGGADSFTSAVFLHADGAHLYQVRRACADHPEADPWHRWVPHVTVGTYRSAVPRHVVAAALDPWRQAPAIRATGRLGVYRVDRSTGLLLDP